VPPTAPPTVPPTSPTTAPPTSIDDDHDHDDDHDEVKPSKRPECKVQIFRGHWKRCEKSGKSSWFVRPMIAVHTDRKS
jgi:hypothetical protein